MKSKSYRVARRTALLALIAAANAQAGTIVATWVGADPAAVSANRTIVAGPGAPHSDNVAMVRFDLLQTGGTDPIGLRGSGVAGHFYAFCLEPRQFITQNTSIAYDVGSVATAPTNLGGMGATKADQINELFGRYQPDLGGAMTSQTAGALQIAIWEIVRETPNTSLDVLAGNISFGPSESVVGMITLAQSFVTSLDGTGPKAFGLFALMNGTFNNPDTGAGTQDLLVQQVPEPSSLLSVASGVIGMIGFAYRRRHLKV